MGFSFNHDIDMFVRKFPKMQFYRYIKRFIDAQTYYARVFLAPPQSGLAKVAEKVLGKSICKREQMSNWERRPLRKSQMHYAAMDAYVLVKIIQKLSERGADEGHPIQTYIFALDKRNYAPTLNEDDDGAYYDDDEEETKAPLVIN